MTTRPFSGSLLASRPCILPSMRPLLILLVLGWLPSCVHVFTTHYDYQATAPAPTAAGSAFRVEFIPKATESGIALSAMVVGGALVAEVGPYQMRLHAFGQPEDQQWFEIKSLRLSGSDHFEAPMQARGFAGRAEFKPTQTPGTTRASLLLGPYVSLDAKKQHDIVLDAEVLVMRRSGLTRGTLRIPLALTKTKRRDSTNVIAEIAHDIRDRDKPTIPAALPPPPEKP
jgi:hypothetical protein